MLTNAIRRYFGIKEIDEKWKRLDIKGFGREYLLVDANHVIQKFIYPVEEDGFSYREVDYNVQLNSELKIVEKKGKERSLTMSKFLAIKSGGKHFEVDENSLKLINYANGLQLFNEYDLKWKSATDALAFLNRKMNASDDFFTRELDAFLNRKKPVNQKYRQGDIFRVRLGNDKFAYGRVIVDLEKFTAYETGIVSEWVVDIRGRSILNGVIVQQVLIDFFMVITDNPNWMYADLENFKTTPSVIISNLLIKHEEYIIVDHSEIAPSSFDMPMGIDTYIQFIPVCHIFKWGACVVTFKADKEVEKLINKANKIGQFLHGPKSRSTQLYITSCIEGNPEYAYFTGMGDLRSSKYEKLRAMISRYLNVDLANDQYDAFADKYGFMNREKVLVFTNS